MLGVSSRPSKNVSQKFEAFGFQRFSQRNDSSERSIMRRTNRFICFLKYELISVVSVDKRCMYIYIHICKILRRPFSWNVFRSRPTDSVDSNDSNPYSTRLVMTALNTSSFHFVLQCALFQKISRLLSTGIVSEIRLLISLEESALLLTTAPRYLASSVDCIWVPSRNLMPLLGLLKAMKVHLP